MNLKWTKKLSVGNEIIDSEHRNLISNEEEMVQAVNFDFSKHKPAQQYSLKELQHMRDELIAKCGLMAQ